MNPQQPYMGTPQQPAPSGHVSLSPFKHLIAGNKDLFKTNFLTAFVVGIVGAVASFVILLLYELFGATLVANSILNGNASLGSFIFKIIALSILYLIIVCALISLINLSTMRAVVQSTKNIKITVGQAFSFSFERFFKAFLTNIVTIGIIYVAEIIFLLITIAAHQPLLSVVVGLAFFVGMIIYVLRITYVQYVLADDNVTDSPLATIRRSSKLWQKSGGALILYWLMIFVIALILGIVLGSNGSSKTTTSVDYSSSYSSNINSYNSGYTGTPDITGTIPSDYLTQTNLNTTHESSTVKKFTAAIIITLLVTSLIGYFIALLFMAGMANIYKEAKEKLDGITGGMQPTMTSTAASAMPYGGPAPVGPVGYPQPMQAMPMAPQPIQQPMPAASQQPMQPQTPQQPIPPAPPQQ
jgi:hypothetical protein